MAKELFPSSFECDCGNESHFCENTVREMKRMSKKKRVSLGDDYNLNWQAISNMDLRSWMFGNGFGDFKSPCPFILAFGRGTLEKVVIIFHVFIFIMILLFIEIRHKRRKN